ncbi:MAG: DUF6265 family protein [Breznakibacter sp.]
MRTTATFFAFLFVLIVSAQTELPAFLEGTWKTEQDETYEHWDKLNDNHLKGFSYKIKDGQITVSKYLDISRTRSKIIYHATVLHQNSGKSIGFKLIKNDHTYSFANPKHDFPKIITYQKLSDTEVLVKISDGKQKNHTYKLTKHVKYQEKNDSTILNPNYDTELAQKLDADDYGMKSYIWVILKTGSNQISDNEFISEKFRGHLANINRLVEQKKLVVAGPLGKNDKQYRGIFILQNIGSIDEAKELLLTDPAIKEGLLDTELYKWYGSAALPEYLEKADKIWKKNP